MNFNRSLWSWCLYDFANSAFITSVATFIFPIFFKKVLMPSEGIEVLGVVLEGKTTFPLLIASALLLVFIISPWLGSIADKSNRRKLFLMGFCGLGSFSTMGLFFTQKGDFYLGCLLFVGGMIGFSLGNVFYNSLMKDLVGNQEVPKLSARGWALGYAGGFLALILHILLIELHQKLGIDKGLATRIALGSTGLWWLIFAIPLMLNVKESSRHKITSSENESELKSGSPLSNIVESFQLIRSIPYLGFFLMAFFLYNDAVQTTISQATNLAHELLGMEISAVLAAGMMIQFVAIFGSLLFLKLEQRFSTRGAVSIALVNWILILIWALIMQTPSEFYVLCAWVGLVLGITQSGSRTLFAQQIPENHSAQLFAFYTLADKASSVVGPILFAASTLIFPIRYAVVPMLLMLILGTYILQKVKFKESS